MFRVLRKCPALSHPPHPPPRKIRKVRKIFGFCSRDRRVRSEYLELRKTLSVLYSKCERCTAPVRSGRGAQISPRSDCFGKKFGFCSGDTAKKERSDFFAAGLGIEPKFSLSESDGLPLADPAIILIDS